VRQFLRSRQELLKEVECAEVALRRASAQRVWSLAWELRPDLVGSSAPDDGSMLRQWVRDNMPMLREEIRRRRERATRNVDSLSARPMPLSTAEWAAWFSDHSDEFRRLIDTALALRKAANRRLQASPDAPPPAPRLGSKSVRPRLVDLPPWQQWLWGRTGWHCLKVRGGEELRLIFLVWSHGEEHCVDCSCLRDGQRHTFGENAAIFLVKEMRPLPQLEVGEVLQAFDCFVSAAAAPGSVAIAIERARQIIEPLPSARSSCKRERGGDGGDDGDGGEPSDTDAELNAETAKEVASGTDSCPSVDTDDDSGLEELMSASKNKTDDAGASDLEGVSEGDGDGQ